MVANTPLIGGTVPGTLLLFSRAIPLAPRRRVLAFVEPAQAPACVGIRSWVAAAGATRASNARAVSMPSVKKHGLVADPSRANQALSLGVAESALKGLLKLLAWRFFSSSSASAYVL